MTASTSFHVFGLTGLGFEPTTLLKEGQHATIVSQSLKVKLLQKIWPGGTVRLKELLGKM